MGNLRILVLVSLLLGLTVACSPVAAPSQTTPELVAMEPTVTMEPEETTSPTEVPITATATILPTAAPTSLHNT